MGIMSKFLLLLLVVSNGLNKKIGVKQIDKTLKQQKDKRDSRTRLIYIGGIAASLLAVGSYAAYAFLQRNTQLDAEMPQPDGVGVAEMPQSNGVDDAEMPHLAANEPYNQYTHRSTVHATTSSANVLGASSTTHAFSPETSNTRSAYSSPSSPYIHGVAAADNPRDPASRALPHDELSTASLPLTSGLGVNDHLTGMKSEHSYVTPISHHGADGEALPNAFIDDQNTGRMSVLLGDSGLPGARSVHESTAVVETTGGSTHYVWSDIDAIPTDNPLRQYDNSTTTISDPAVAPHPQDS